MYSRIHIITTLELQEIVQLVAQVMIVIIIGYRWVTSNKSILQQNSLKISRNSPKLSKHRRFLKQNLRMSFVTFERIVPSTIFSFKHREAFRDCLSMLRMRKTFSDF